MAFNIKQLYQGLAGTSAAILYTVPAGRKTVVKELIVCNVSVGAATLDLHLVPPGDSAGPANQILDAASFNAGETKQYQFSQGLEEGATIQAVASAGSALCLTLSGVEVS